MAKKISQLTQATEVKSDDVTVIVQDGETKKLPLNMMVTKQDIENKKIAGLAKLDEIEATYENDTYTPTITVKNKSSVKTGEGDEVDYSANVMDGHVKSAILKGQTLVNYFPEYTKTMAIGTGAWRTIFNGKINIPLTPNTSYLFINNSNVGKKINVSVIGETTAERNVIANLTTNIAKFTTPDTTDNFPRMNVYLMEDNTSELTYDSFMVIPYQDGMENWDIPYFTGMQSVKLPVLTTTGKNLLNPNYLKEQCLKISSSATYTDGNIVFHSGAFHKKRLIALDFEPNTQYAFNFKMSGKQGSQLHIKVYYTDNTDSSHIPYISDTTGIISGITNANATVEYITISFGNGASGCVLYVDECSLFKSNTVMPHEPFKSNILAVNEEVELRGIGDVKDELNLITGEMIENFESFTFNGSEDWKFHDDSLENTTRFILLNYASNKVINQKYGICNNFAWGNYDTDFPGILVTKPSGHVYLRTPKMSVDELKTMLSNNPIHGYYNKEKSIKTVDLIPSGTHPSTTPYCWKDGHIQLSSSGLLPSLEYSVVTSRAGQISQNAAMIVKNDKRIFDLEILLAGGLVNTTYQALTLQNQVETGLSKVSLSSEKEPDYLLYHMIMKLIEEKAYKLDDLAEKVSVFYLYEKLSDEQFETIYSELYPFVEEEYIESPEDGEIIEEPIVDEVLEEVENGVVM